MRTWGQINVELSKFLSGVDPQLRIGWINSAYHRILASRNWKGLEIEAWLQTVDAYSTGTISVTLGSNAVTGTGTTFTALMSTRKIRIDGRNEWYTFTRVSGTTGTLDRNYEGDTDALATYRIYQDTYSLPAGCKFIQVMENVRTGLKLTSRNRSEMDDISASRLGFGEPSIYSTDSDTPEASPPVLHTVELYPAPEFAAGFPYTYQFNPNDFTGQNTSASPLPWVSDDAILAYTKASMLRAAKDYSGSNDEEAVAAVFLSTMNREENERVGGVRIRMAPRFTAHRKLRWQR